MLSILETLNFSLVAEALTGLIYHRPWGENSSFALHIAEYYTVSEPVQLKDPLKFPIVCLHIMRG